MTDPAGFPLSLTQSDIWLAQTFHEGSPLFNIGGVLKIKGPIDPDLFCRSHDRLLAGSDAFRIMLSRGNPSPSLSFSDEVPPIEVLDLSGYADPHGRVHQWMATEFARPFSLYDSVLGRRRLLKAGDDAWYYFSVQHHLVMDGYSYSLLARRVALAYNDLLEGNTQTRAFPSYGDLIRSDQAYLASDTYRADEAFWARKAGQEFPVLIPRRYAAQFHSQTLPSAMDLVWLDRPFYEEAKALAKSLGGGIFHLITAVLYAYFIKTVRTRPFVFGLPMLNRHSPEFKQTVGPFVNVLPVAVDWGTDLCLEEFFQRFNTEGLDYFVHQRFPLSRINRLAGLHQKRRHQLFDIGISYERFLYDDRLGTTPCEAHTLYNGFDQNALSVAVKEYQSDQDVKLEFSYSLGAFTPTEIAFLKERIVGLIRQVMENPRIPLGRLNILPEKERTCLVNAFNPTPSKPPPSSDDALSFEDLFRAQVRIRPQAPALIRQGRALTYGELNRRAEHLAARLLENGAVPGSLIGICMPPCPDLIAGILAILRVGAAWVPLDPDYPRDRIAFMIQDAGLSLILIRSSRPEVLDSVLADRPGLFLVSPDDSGDASPSPETPPEVQQAAGPCRSVRPKPDDAAYVIYTSGTTGQPKGVVCTHRGLANLVRAQGEAFGIGPTSRVLQFASICFDAAVSEIATALASGAALVLADRQDLMPGPPLLDFLGQEEITHVTLPPSALAVMAPRELPRLEILVVAGEACPSALARTWGKGRRIINAYGPTEGTVCAAMLAVRDPAPGMLPLGRPMDGITLYLLDPAMRPVPLGVPGEIYIGGAGVAKGYLNRPELTAARFVPDPFSKGTLYRTGDLARFLTPDTLAFMGRLDRQVKVRGFRIEPQEIEAVLCSHSGVGDAAVTLEGETDLDRRLIGHVTAGQGREPVSPAEIRSYLADRLPAHMIPPRILCHDRFPLTPNGKIDLAALAQRAAVPEASPDESGPATRTQKILAELFSSALDRPAPGPNQDLFEAGMDSLKAMGFLAAVERAFDIRISPARLMSCRTIATLAPHLEPFMKPAQGREDTEKILIPLNTRGDRIPFFCVTAGYGDLMAFKVLAGLLDRPFYLLQPPSPGSESGPRDAQTLAGVYRRALDRICPAGPVHIGGYSAGGLLAYELARQRESAGKGVSSLVLLGAPLAYSTGAEMLNRIMGKLLPHLIKRPELLRFDPLRILHALFMDPGLQDQLGAVREYIPRGFWGRIDYFQGRWATSRFLGSHRKWERRFPGLNVHLVPGSHDSFLRHPHVRTLARQMSLVLARNDEEGR